MIIRFLASKINKTAVFSLIKPENMDHKPESVNFAPGNPKYD